MTTSETLRVPPHSIEAEQSVLGGLMLDNQAFLRIQGKISAGDFYRRDHQLIFAACAELADESQPMDIITLSDRLERKNSLETVGGLGYLGMLAKNTPSAANIASYAGIVWARSMERGMLKISANLMDAAFDTGKPVGELVDIIQSAATDFYEKTACQDVKPSALKDILRSVLDRIDEAYMSGGEKSVLALGLPSLDAVLQGIERDALVVVGGRPSMGKTSFALTAAVNVAAANPDEYVLIFSLETIAESIGYRLLSMTAGVSYKSLLNGNLHDEDFPKMTAGVSKLAACQIEVEDMVGMRVTPASLTARTKYHAVKRGKSPSLILVDYLSFIHGDTPTNSKVEEIGDITRKLKSLAKEMACPIVLLSQLSRDLERRPNKRPIPSDLRDSGAIEQDADVIIFIYRDEVYDPDSPDKGLAELIVAKNRNGAPGTARAVFDARNTRFMELARDVL